MTEETRQDLDAKKTEGLTITAKELYDATMRGEGMLAKHARDNPDMPVFLLLAQDQHAAALVEKWVIWADINDASAFGGKPRFARQIADMMWRWPVKKAPD